MQRIVALWTFYNILLGYFFGFALGVGSALAVMYTIYTSGYRKGYKMGIDYSVLNENRSSGSRLLHLMQKTNKQ
jgi:hypothetical protein